MEKAAILKIEDCWIRFRDSQLFKLLKYALSMSDHTLTHEIMRKINPAEAELFKDPVFKTIIRFRFAGEEFPPYIVFKVFIKTDGHGVKYINGKKFIRPATEAAADSCKLMGNRKFLDQIIHDLCEENQCSINDELDVSNLKDYMKYVSVLDEMSVKTGGKGNTWRTLTLEAVPRQHIIYDVLTYLQEGKKTERFVQQIYDKRRFLPLTQSQQLEYIQTLSRKWAARNKNSEPSRRSKQALARAEQMRKLYKSANEDEFPHKADEGNENFPDYTAERQHSPSRQDKDDVTPFECFNNIDFNENSWDEEGKLLFEWTKNLSIDNVLSR